MIDITIAKVTFHIGALKHINTILTDARCSICSCLILNTHHDVYLFSLILLVLWVHGLSKIS